MNVYSKPYITALFIITATKPLSADDDNEKYATPAPIPAYQEECGGACHIAFPPKMLPDNSWQQIMQSLDQHFGSNASLEPQIEKEISAWLIANSRHKAHAPPENRITRTKWFIHEHHEIAATIWQRPAIRTAVNCPACHVHAASGQFDEQSIHIP